MRVMARIAYSFMHDLNGCSEKLEWGSEEP